MRLLTIGTRGNCTRFAGHGAAPTGKLRSAHPRAPVAMPPAEFCHAELVAHLLRKVAGPHLRARTYGATVMVESGPHDDPVKHARFRRATVNLWRLDIASPTGRWTPTPLRAPLCELIDFLSTDCPWTLIKIG